VHRSPIFLALLASTLLVLVVACGGGSGKLAGLLLPKDDLDLPSNFKTLYDSRVSNDTYVNESGSPAAASADIDQFHRVDGYRFQAEDVDIRTAPPSGIESIYLELTEFGSTLDAVAYEQQTAADFAALAGDVGSDGSGLISTQTFNPGPIGDAAFGYDDLEGRPDPGDGRQTQTTSVAFVIGSYHAVIAITHEGGTFNHDTALALATQWAQRFSDSIQG
jgi:hypothetical protein